jgi:DNA processing protein
MLHEEKIAWMRLLSTGGIGNVTFKHLIKKFDNARNAIKELPEFLKNFPNRKINKVPDALGFEKYVEKCGNLKVDLIFAAEDRFPKNLKRITDYPMILHCLGNKELLYEPSLAVVGSRNASFQGISFARQITFHLMNKFKIVSGLAKGIDAAAHEASLKTGTVAVLGSGVDVVYPSENQELYDKILQNNGLIISESFLQAQPRPNLFTYRNRIIAGLSQGVLVVEAALKSGSLITANYALEQGKDIFAVPGHPNDFRVKGSNQLIKNGAYLVENADDILQHFENNFYKQEDLFEEEHELVQDELDLSDVVDIMRETLGHAPISINEIIRSSNFDINQVQSSLAILELEGFIEIEGNLVRKI